VKLLPRWQGALGDLRRRPWLAAAVALICLGVGVLVYSVAAPQIKAWSHWRQAGHALANYDFPQARAHLAWCLAIWPTSGEAHFLLARTCRREWDFAGARTHLQEAKRLRWPVAAIDLEFKLIQAQSGDVRAVEKTLHNYLESGHPDEVLIFEALVSGYLQSNLLNDTYHWATVWIKRHPGMWFPLMMRGLVLERSLKFDLAMADYQAAIELKPDHVKARLRVAEMLLRRGRFDEALPHFQAGFAEFPGDPAVMIGLAKCYRSLAQVEAAEKVVAAGLERYPQHPQLLQLRGQLEADNERFEAALAWLRRAEAQAPNDRGTVFALANVLGRLGKAEEARKYDERGRQLVQSLGQVDQLIREVAETEGKNPARNVQCRHELGKLLLSLGQEEEGLQWLASALNEDPNHEPTRKALAEYEQKMNTAPPREPVRPLTP
jgi:tetratricopeptide (TPR) repeat protein